MKYRELGFSLLILFAAGTCGAKMYASADSSGSSLFMRAVNYDSGGFFANSVAAADLNGDGNLDLVIANLSPSGSISYAGPGVVGVLLGKGDGTFQTVVTYPSGACDTRSVAVADVNGDGRLDVVVASSSDTAQCRLNGPGTISILLGNGDGTLRLPVTYSSGAYGAWFVAVADINGDAKLDLVMTNLFTSPAWSSTGNAAVLIGNGDGTFQGPVTYGLFGHEAASVTVADVNSDGWPDLLVALHCESYPSCGSGQLAVLLNNADGTFRTAGVYDSGGFYAVSVSVADLNKDGRLDLVVGNSYSGTGILLGNGDGSFQPALVYAPAALWVAVADVNGDGKPDLIATVYRSVDVLLGNGDGTFQPAVTYSADEDYVSSVAVADLNGDGKPDLTVGGGYYNGYSGTGSVAVLLNKSTTSTSLISSLNPSTYGQRVTWTSKVTTSGSVTPTGVVKFTWSRYTIGSATLDSSGTAVFSKSILNADPYPLTAVYVGDAGNLGSTSDILNQVVLQTTSSATLTSSSNPSTQGQAVTFTATIISPTVTPTGPVTFAVGKTVLGTAQLSRRKATFTTSTLAVGAPKVTATYYGNSNIAKSSASVTQTVH